MTDKSASPSISEIAALTRRLRDLSRPGRTPDPAEVERFLADKQELLDRIAADHAAADDSDADAGGAELHVHSAVRNRPLDDDAERQAGDIGVSPNPWWDDYRIYTPGEAAAELVARGIPPDNAPAIVDRFLDAQNWERGWSPQDQWQIDDDDLAVMTENAAAAGGPPVIDPAEDENERRAQLQRWADNDETTHDVVADTDPTLGRGWSDTENGAQA